MLAFYLGIGEIWQKVYTTPALWHFHYVNSPIALELVKGRERIFLEHFWQTLSPHPETFPEADRRLYAKAYAQEGAMRAAFEMFKQFDTQDAADNRRFAATKLPMPVLTIEGDKAMGGALETQAKLVATNVTSDRVARYWALAYGTATDRNKNAAKKILRQLKTLRYRS